ncbi:PKD domain-containing protein [Aureisphaera galaxeae]|uniref:T9SS type A sorting domain-containing protein n=1 Tax=Aureisphaera galaxeae TaxID=1538023 RepID=UPI00234FDFA8|nr:PKD domain-containing protein [Aureisphaera galaxeae]MDC8004677.1 PKD domain-containing protein [Aureisphaera galaxeae]
MKNIYYKIPSIRWNVFILLMLFSISSIHAQWDYVNFTDDPDKTLRSGTIDDNDNVYAFGDGPSFTRVLRKFDPAGNLVWTKDISSLLTTGTSAQNATGGTEFGNNNTYTVGALSNQGVIVESGLNAGDTPVNWETVTGGSNIILDVKIIGNDMYVVGTFGTTTSSSTTITLDGGTNLTGSYVSTYIAKYNIAPKSLVWATKIDASNITRGVNLDVDDTGNVYVTGEFRGTAIFYNGGSNLFNSTSSTYPDTFMAKFDANGDFDNTFGLKVQSLGGNKRSYDVEVSNENNAVYWAEAQYIHAYDKNGSGSFQWTHALPNSSWAFSLETNGCGDLYATGQADVSVTLTRAPCGGDFFGLSLDSSSGSTVWPSNSESCSSFGGEVLIDSNNREVFVGTYYSSGGSQPLVIDGTYSSGASKGYFIGRYDDSTQNSCCDPVIDLGADVTVCADGQFPTLDISGQVSGSPTITWFQDGTPVQSGGLTFTTTSYGVYSVTVVYDADCTATGSMEVNNNGCCDFSVDLGPNIEICEGDPWPVLDITGQIPGFTSIVWELDGNAFPQPVNSETVTTQGPGTYTVMVTYGDGCTTSDAVVLSVIDCGPDCQLLPKMKMKMKDCTISVGDISTAGSGTTIVGYLWDFGDGNTAVGPNAIHSYTAPGTYILTLTVYGLDANGNCCLVSIQKQVIITKQCPDECGMKPQFTLENAGNGVGLFSSTSFGNAFTTIVGYEWTVNGTVVSTDPYFAMPFSGGQVCLTVYGLTDKGECCQAQACEEYLTAPTEKAVGKELNFEVYPNPSKGQVTLNFEGMNVEGPIEYVIYDVYGRKVHSGTTDNATEVIDNSTWSNGVYMCMAKGGDAGVVKRIIKE